MIQLTRLVNDIFADRELTDAKLRTYADDHLIRLANNNPGAVYTPLITATTALYTAYYGSMTSEATQEAVSEGLTIATNNAADAVLNKLSKQRDLVSYKFGTDSPIYQQFFPQGVDEYRRARLDDLTTLLDRYMAAANLHLNAEFPTEVTDIGNLIAAYIAARNAQRDAFSEVDTLRTGRRESRKALTLQLTRNILTLAIDFLDNPDGFDDYYDAQLLPMGAGGGSGDDDTDNPDTPVDTLAIVSGFVTDMSSGTPLGGAEVTLINSLGQLTTYTNATGFYNLKVEGIPETVTAELRVSLAGYAMETRPLVLEQGGSYAQDVALTIAP